MNRRPGSTQRYTQIGAAVPIRAVLALVLLVPAARADPADGSTAQALEPGQPLHRELAAGETHAYRLAISAEHYLRLRLEQKGIDLALTLFGPRGGVLKEADGPGGRWVEEVLSLVTDMPGDFRLEVTARPESTNAGEYVLLWEEARPATAREALRIEAEELHYRGRHLRQLSSGKKRREAVTLFRHALPLWRELEDRDGEADSLDQIGGVHLTLGEPRQALRHFQQALDLYTDSGNRRGRADAHNDIGIALVRLGQAPEALHHYRKALALWSEIGDRRGEAMTLNAVASLYRSTGALAEALDAYERSLALRREVGDLPGEGVTLRTMGILYQGLGQIEEALWRYERALEIARETADRRREMFCLVSLGSAHQAQGDLEEALHGYAQALEVARSLGDRPVEQRALSQLGAAYRDLGEPERALELFDAALELARKEEHRSEEAWCLMEIGWLHDDLRQLDKAAQHFELALAKCGDASTQETELYARRGLGRAYRRQGRITPALEELQRAVELSERLGRPLAQVDAMREMGQAHLDLEHPGKARDLFHRSLELNHTLEDPFREAKIRADLARTHKELGELGEARAEIENALGIYSSLRTKVSSPDLRASFHSSRYQDHELYVTLLMDLHRLDPERGLAAQALAASESARARSLVELLAQAGIEVREGVYSELREREDATQRQLSWIQGQLIRELSSAEKDEKRLETLRSQLRKTRGERERLEVKIRRRHPRYAGIRYPQALDLEGIRSLLDERTALLEYALGEESSYLFVVTRKTFTALTLAPAGEIGDAVQQVRSATSRPGRRLAGRLAEASSLLYELLIQPAAESLADIDRLLIVPDQDLYYLPFEALLRGPQEYLLDRWAVGYAPSASVLASLLGRRHEEDEALAAQPKAFVGFAEPVHHGEHAEPADSTDVRRSLVEHLEEWSVQPLPASGDEVRAVAELFEPHASRIYVGEEAGEENVKRNPLVAGARQVHFATHGLLDDHDPAYSGLLLSMSQGGREDGLLQVHEIFNLKISADLVVLSACETGTGKQVRGEGIIGLSRAFMYAGASSLVVSLWQVADESTAELMLGFYRHLRAGADKAEALRAAKQELARDERYSHPFYWAPFILVGSPD